MEKFTPLAKVLHLTEWLFLPKICQSSFSFGKRLFRVSASGEWLSTGNGKEYFRPDALRAVDWPSTPQTIWPWKRHALRYTSTGSGIIPKKNIFLVLPYSFSTLHVTYFLLSILSRYLNPIHMFGANMLVWEKENKSLFEPSPIQWSHSNGSVLHMTNIKSNFHKKIFEWIGSL